MRSVEDLSKQYLEPGSRLGRLKEKCMMRLQRNGPDIVVKKDDGTDVPPEECSQPGFKWVDYEDLWIPMIHYSMKSRRKKIQKRKKL